jgi:hypothetical protein
MELVIFMLFMVLGFLFFDRANQVASRNSNEVVKKCHDNDDIHDWSYHPVTKKLTCVKCNYEAYSEQ